MTAQSAGEGEIQYALIHGSASLNKCVITTVLWLQCGSCTQEIRCNEGSCTNSGISVYICVPRQRSCCRTVRRKKNREGLTCAVCLDIYICPHICRPCGPCLRTIINNRPMNTPCSLCWSHTSASTKVSDWLHLVLADSGFDGKLGSEILQNLRKWVETFIFRAQQNGSDLLPQSVLRPQAEL